MAVFIGAVVIFAISMAFAVIVSVFRFHNLKANFFLRVNYVPISFEEGFLGDIFIANCLLSSAGAWF